jgi:hypothetical protein
MAVHASKKLLLVASHAPKPFEQSIPSAAGAVQRESKPRPVLVKGSRKLPSKPLQSFAPEPAVIHEVRELLHLSAMVLAIAESRASEDAELLHFLRLGERAVADIGTLIAAHFQSEQLE